MVIYKCTCCEKEFNKKCNFDYHTTNRKKPCKPKAIEEIPTINVITNDIKEVIINVVKEVIANNANNVKDVVINDVKDVIVDNVMENIITDNSAKCICKHCNVIFSKNGNLQRHMNLYCKPLKDQNELELVKEQLNSVMNDNKALSTKIELLSLENKKLKDELNKNIVLLAKARVPKPKDKIPLPLKNAIWNKYFEGTMFGTCVCCKATPIHSTNFDAGHVKSEHLGGKVHIDNLRPICRTCNSSMGTQNMDDYMKKYGFDKLTIPTK